MHKHLSTPSPDGRPSLLDNISDSLVNAFTKVRKPDERFIEMRESIDKYEEAMNGIDRLIAKERSRTEGISSCGVRYPMLVKSFGLISFPSQI
jgi:sorting nexin-4